MLFTGLKLVFLLKGFVRTRRIVEQADWDEIFENPAHPYNEALVRGIPQPDSDKRRDLMTIEGEVSSLNATLRL